MKRNNDIMQFDLATNKEEDHSKITRDDFPADFIFGTGTAAYQHEGAAKQGDRGISIWDSFTCRTPFRIEDGSNGNVAIDMYYRFKEDVDYMKKMGFDSFRFSISWPRVLPGGRRCAGVNKEGIKFYNELIDTLLANGIEPFVTLFHWDLPQCLQDEYAGFLDRRIVHDYKDYVELCFWEFGDRVKNWVTLNETWTYCNHGYAAGIFPPSPPPPPKHHDHHPSHKLSEDQDSTSEIKSHFNFRVSKTLASLYHSTHVAADGLARDKSRDDFWDPKNAYIVARNLLLAHAAAVQLYRTKFQEQQGGKIGITLVSHWFEPLDPHKEDDRKAARRAVDFMLGWFLEPIMKGRYPQSMVEYAGEHLAEITDEEFKMIKGSIDFLGQNYYTTYYVTNDPNPKGRDGYIKDQHLKQLTKRHGIPIGPVASGSSWLNIVPWGIRKLLKFVNETYNSDDKQIPVYITENGVDEDNNCKKNSTEACWDHVRIKYHQDHLANIQKSITIDNVNVKGYFAWSYADNFEWAQGYMARFGIMYIDFADNMARLPKESAYWFSKFLVRNPIPPPNLNYTTAAESKKRLRAMAE